MFKRTSLALATLATAVLVGSSSAAVLTAGQTAFAVSEVNPVGGSVLQTLVTPFATANYTGFLTSSAITGDTSNPFGGLTFTYSLSNDAGSANAITRLTVNGYQGYATDMSYQLGTGTVAPTINDRDASGGVVGFAFMGQPIGVGVLAAGTTSETLVVQTNALDRTIRIANVSNGAVSPVNALGPAGGITPEPASLAALAGLGLVFRRRR
jgi:hypothetical protein